MSDIKREWINAGAEALARNNSPSWAIERPPSATESSDTEVILAAVLPLIANDLRNAAGDPRSDAYMRGYYEGVAQGYLEAADLIWKEGTDG